MLNLPLDWRYLAPPLLLLVVSFALYLVEPVSSDWLRYQRTEVLNGEIWRLVTGNFVHTNFAHVVLNCLGIVIIWVLHAEHYCAKRYLGVLTASALATGLGIHFFGDLENYAGLSGALHGVIAYGAVKDIQAGIRFGWPLLIGIIVKVAYENLVGASDDVSNLIEASVAVDAHLYGLIAGLITALPVFYAIACKNKQREKP